MKTKLFKHTVYLFFILLTFSSCMNEMDVIENELDLKINNKQLYDPFDTRVKALIDYEGSTRDKNILSQVEMLLQTIYGGVPELCGMIDEFINKGFKFRISVKYPPGGWKESWYNPNNPPEIGFSGNEYITLGHLLHELLHVICFDIYEEYQQGLAPASEEYETRVLTDVFMRRYFKNWEYVYQGMRYENNSYVSYLDWLDKIIYDDNYRMEDFMWTFKQYAAFCILDFKGEKPNMDDLKNYTPQLLYNFWFSLRKR